MKILKQISENLHLKIISLILGLFVWVNAITDDISLYKLNYEIIYVFQDLGDTLMVVNELPQKIEVTLKTTGKNYIKLRFSKRLIIKNAGKIKYGTNIIPISQEDIPVSLRETEIFSVKPEQVVIEVDRIENKKIPILPGHIELSNELIEIRESSVHPESILISGPSSLIRKLQYILTEPISIRSLSDTLHSVSINVLPKRFFKIDSTFKKVTVKVRLDTLTQATYELKTRFRGKTLKVIVVKPLALHLEPQDFKVKFIPIDSTPEMKFYKVEITPPARVKVKSIEPEIISVP